MKHRGKHPQDELLFSGKKLEDLYSASKDVALFLEKGYPLKAVLKITGDKFKFTKRQRIALERISCSFSTATKRKHKFISLSRCGNKKINIDGYNVLITVESLLSEGIVLRCMDSAIRDMASVHGTYKRVEETVPAIKLIGNILSRHEISDITWYLDSPISNSGRLKQLLLEIATEYNYSWNVELVNNPDIIIASSSDIAATSDSWILDRCKKWTSIPEEVLAELQNSVFTFAGHAKITP